MNLTKLFKRRLIQKETCRMLVSKKLAFEIHKLKEELEKEFKKQKGYKRKIPLSVVSDLIADQVRRKRYKDGR